MLECSVFGIKLRFSFLFFAVITAMTLIDRTGVALIGFAACIAHELGHILAFLRIHLKPQELCFEASGLKLVNPQRLLSFKQELFVLAAGPFVNLVLGIALLPRFPSFAAANLVLCGFNLLPVFALDGGKLIYTLLCMRLEVATAHRLLTVISVLVLVPLTACGGLFVYKTRNMTLLITTLYLAGLLLFKSKD